MSERTPTVLDELQVLEGDVAELAHRWRHFYDMFTSDLFVGMANDQAPSFFATVHDLLLESIRLRLAKLIVDPPHTNNDPTKSNLTLARVLSQCGPENEQRIRDSLRADFARLDSIASTLRDHRHWLDAHRDLSIALKVKQLPTLYFDELNETIRAICHVVEELHRTLKPDSSTSFDEPFIDGGYDQIIRTLEAADNWATYTMASRTGHSFDETQAMRAKSRPWLRVARQP